MSSSCRAVLWMMAFVGYGCAFTSRPMLPIGDDGGLAALRDGATSDVGVAFDAPTAEDASVGDVMTPPDITEALDGAPPASADATGPSSDASSVADAPVLTDGDCRPVGDGGLFDGGDAGFVNARGEPCDPNARPDASVDATFDGTTRDLPRTGEDR